MVNILALATVAWATVHTPTPISDTQVDRQVEETQQSAGRMTPKKNEWFEHAIDRILRGE